MRKETTLLNTTVEETMARYENSVARYANVPDRIPRWQRILRAIGRLLKF